MKLTVGGKVKAAGEALRTLCEFWSRSRVRDASRAVVSRRAATAQTQTLKLRSKLPVSGQSSSTPFESGKTHQQCILTVEGALLSRRPCADCHSGRIRISSQWRKPAGHFFSQSLLNGTRTQMMGNHVTVSNFGSISSL